MDADALFEPVLGEVIAGVARLSECYGACYPAALAVGMVQKQPN
jgi:hypothetical protein